MILADSFLIDASVMAKWFNKGESNEEEALSLRTAWIEQRVEIYSPSLIIYEVCNSVWKNPNIDRDQARSLAMLTVRLRPTFIEITEEDSEEAMMLARKSKLTFYDTIYIVLSKVHTYPLISADNNQINAAKAYTTSIHISKIKSMIGT